MLNEVVERVPVMRAISTRRIEQNRLASHLTATVSWLWIKALLCLALGALLGVLFFGERSRGSPSRPVERTAGVTARGAHSSGN